MTDLDKDDFLNWAYSNLLTNTTRGVLAEYIVAKACGVDGKPRVEWHKYDLDIGGIWVEVKSSAFVQSWTQTGPSKITFNICATKGWDEPTNTYEASAQRSAHVYVFCLLNGEHRDAINPLAVAQWTFYVLPASKLPEQKSIGLGPLKALRPRECKYVELRAAIHEAAAVSTTPG
ncbi:hypothetical protein MAIC_15480 [Mycolicibacterium aichiense]|uniref:Uncharacterized protein n=1 Tax=Mycolicibacterium aichiense TaxID=1799 RepID=A0AAD1HJW2_9MYCO|nr:hypothetical protein [Mycolicibacterium aichiense]MCV7017646.1 hypothetical protein [Mycolicibacterium aichiense]BBX06745.1 hypothetical protein MAIC_15480 [Mycolicibacterium aichiense]